MKKIFLFLSVLTLSFLGCDSVKAQSDFLGTFVLQNPEVAVIHAVVTFYDNGLVTQEVQNLLTNEKSSVQSSWSFDAKTKILTITESNGNSYRGRVLPLTDAFYLTNLDDNSTDFSFAKPGSTNDHYLAYVKIALDMYGNDASLKKCFPSSSRETGYSFLPRYSTCAYCFGLGKCSNCHGTGSVTYDFREYKTCPSCNGSGTCWYCQGTGKRKNY